MFLAWVLGFYIKSASQKTKAPELLWHSKAVHPSPLDDEQQLSKIIKAATPVRQEQLLFISVNTFNTWSKHHFMFWQQLRNSSDIKNGPTNKEVFAAFLHVGLSASNRRATNGAKVSVVSSSQDDRWQCPYKLPT